jgi:SulP family sulfate permease
LKPSKEIKNSNLSNELNGGLSGLIMSLPGTIAFGTVVFAPLGVDMAAIGILACFMGAFLGGLLSAMFGASKVMISGPRSFSVVILAALGALVYQVLSPQLGADNAVTSAILLVLVTSFLSGLIQLIIGLLKLGNLIKFIPFPIISGLMNLSALVVILTQIWPILGLSGPPESIFSLSWLSSIQPLAITIGLVSIISMMVGKKYLRRIPPIVFAAVVGISLHYAFAALGFDNHIGQRLPAIEFDIEGVGQYLSFIDAGVLGSFQPLLVPVLFSALSLAVLNSLSTLLTGLTIQQMSDRSIPPSRELAGHGVANMIASLFGGIASTGKTGVTQTNIKAGAQTRTSAIITALGYGLILLLLTPLLVYMPRAVLAGIAIYLSLGLFDVFGKNLLSIFLRWNKNQILDNLGNIIIVSTVLLVGMIENMMVAIAAGLVVTVFEFVYKSANVAVSSVVSGQQRRSRVQRTDSELAVLKEKSDKTLLLKLEGFLFFVVAEQLSKDILEHTKRGADYLILDVTRTNYLDQTGVTVLQQLFKRMEQNKKHLLFCGANSSAQRRHRGNEWQQLLGNLPSNVVFEDADKALEWCENQIIAGGHSDAESDVSFTDCVLVKGLSTPQVDELRQYFEKHKYEPGECLFEQGSVGDCLYVIANGTLDVLAGYGNAGGSGDSTMQPIRLHTFASGSLLGEMSLIDNNLRSAAVVSRTASCCYVLSKVDYLQLKITHPDLAVALISNISSVLSNRLRSANLTISHLSEQVM